MGGAAPFTDSNSRATLSSNNHSYKGKNTMDLISLIITLIVVGVLLWLVNNYIPMDLQIRRILNGVVVVVVIIWLLNVFGILDSIRGIRVGR